MPQTYPAPPWRADLQRLARRDRRARRLECATRVLAAVALALAGTLAAVTLINLIGA